MILVTKEKMVQRLKSAELWMVYAFGESIVGVMFRGNRIVLGEDDTIKIEDLDIYYDDTDKAYHCFYGRGKDRNCFQIKIYKSIR